MTTSVAQKSAEAFRTISEVAETLKLPQHVLRFWETRFTQIKPMKRAGGRRFYRPEDVELLGAIRQLLYGEGYTIKGVQRILREQGPRAVAVLAHRHGHPEAFEPLPDAPLDKDEEGAPDETTAAQIPEAAPSPTAAPAESQAPLWPPALTAERGRPAIETFEAGCDPIDRLRHVLDEIEACRHMLIAARGPDEPA